jgi:lambda family phage tail tape measure protein
MTDRTVKVAIRSELKKGFSDLAGQLRSLEQSLGQIKNLQEGINRLASAFERNNGLRDAAVQAKQHATNLKTVSSAQKQVNDAVAQGVRLAKQYQNEQSKLVANVANLRAAQRAGSITNQQAIAAESRLLSDYVKKTKDLGVLTRQLRAPNGRFMSFSQDAANGVRAMYAQVEQAVTQATPRLITKINNQNGRIKEAVNNIFRPGPATGSNRNSIQAMYNDLFSAYDPNRIKINKGAGLSTMDLVNRNTGVTKQLDPRFEMLKNQYRQLEERASVTSRKIQRLPFSPNPANGAGGWDKLFGMYNKLGHFLFQLQYSTYTLFAVLGVEAIAKQVDSFVSLRNQIARTSDSLGDVRKSMADIYSISKQTFSDPESIARIFSTINKFSTALNLKREDVVGVTGAMAGAFSASPGGAQEKAQARYQFVQALQSNRLGGDELRAILEEAPYVGDILARGLAKVRGLPAGQTVNLRDPNHKITVDEIIKVFANPDIQAEIKKTLGEQARTFGDVMMLGKVRLAELVQKWEEGSGIFGGIIKSLTSILADDKKWNNFVSSIEKATVALLTLAAVSIGKSVITGIGGQITALGAYRAGSALTRTSAGLLGAGGAATEAGIAGTALGATTTETALARMVGPLRVLAPLLDRGAVGLALWGAKMFGITGIIITLVQVAVSFANALNKVLEKISGGGNLLDYMGALWDKVSRAMSGVVTFLENSPLTSWIFSIYNAFKAVVEGILNILGKSIARDPDFQRREDARMYGKDGVFAINDKSGLYAHRAYIVRDENGEPVKDAQGRAQYRTIHGVAGIVDPKYGRSGVIPAFTPDLPYGQKQNPPPQPAGHHHMSEAERIAKRVEEFFRDLQLQVNKIVDEFNVDEQFLSIQNTLDENTKKLLDILNIDSIAKLPKTLKERLEKANLEIKEVNLDKAFRELLKSFDASLGDLKFASRKSGMSDLSGSISDDTRSVLQEAFKSAGSWDWDKLNAYRAASYLGSRSGPGEVHDVVLDDPMTAIKNAIARGDTNQAMKFGQQFFTPQAFDALQGRINEGKGSIIDAEVGGRNRANDLASKQLQDYQKSLGYFGQERDLANQILQIQEDYNSKYGENLAQNSELQAAMAKEIDLAKKRYAVDLQYQANYKNGIKESLKEYEDGLNHLSDEVKQAFTNGLTGLEDQLVSLITTGKANFADLVKSIQQDVARILVRQLIMKPLTHWLDGIFGGANSEQNITAANVNLYASNVTDMTPGGGSGGGGNWFTNIFKSIFKGGGGGLSFGGDSSMDPLPFDGDTSDVFAFHRGGIVGVDGIGRMINSSAFYGASKYHTGGIAGLSPNEVPAILQRGERVLTIPQQYAMARHMGGRGGNTNVFSPTIAISFTSNGQNATEEDARKLQQMVESSIQKQLYDFEIQRYRPGSATYGRH